MALNNAYLQIMNELVEGLRLSGVEKVTLIRDRKTGITISSTCPPPSHHLCVCVSFAGGLICSVRISRGLERIRLCAFHQSQRFLGIRQHLWSFREDWRRTMSYCFLQGTRRDREEGGTP